MRTRFLIWLSLAALLVMPMTVTAQEEYVITPYAWGLQTPRGLSIDANGNLIAALVGSGEGYRDARVIRLHDLDGNGQADNGAEIQDLVNGLPTSNFLPEAFGDAKFGLSDAQVAADGEVTFVTNAFVHDPFLTGWSAIWSTGAPSIWDNSLLTASPYGHFTPYEIANNPANDILESNPYALVLDDAGNAFVTDAAANAVFMVTPDGTISTYAVFLAFPNPDDPDGPTVHTAPTGIVWGPDGALYVGLETGFPWPEGSSIVWRLEDTNGDGDAMDDGEMTAYATGLTTVTDIAFDNQGRLLAVEFRGLLTGEDDASGRVMRLDGDSWNVVAGGLTTPTGITVGWDDTIYVTQEYIGQIVAIRAR